MNQRKRIVSHRLWGRHPSFYENSWNVLSSGIQKEVAAEKKIREMDSKWELTILPVGDVPHDLYPD